MKLKNLRKTEDNMGYFSNKDEQFGQIHIMKIKLTNQHI